MYATALAATMENALRLPQDRLKNMLEWDAKGYEVRLRGEPLKLERRPMELLLLLLEHHGELVTRDAIERRLWGDGVFVDADQGINTAVNKIRQALCSDPATASSLQTVIGKGYRFVGPVTRVGQDAAASREAAITPPVTCAIAWDGRSLALREGVNVIGRDPEATVAIDSSTVSRRHAQITVTGAAATIEDLGSKNATRVNGLKIDGAVRLADHDVLQIGSTTLVFRQSSLTGSTLTAVEPAD
jgi:DNA-binding winged helix-turn-helix (wHTH) protein